MPLRNTLILLLVTGILGLLVLLPGTPLVLGWLWNSATAAAEAAGYQLTASRVDGNAWRGVTVSGLGLSGPGLELSSREASVRYGLLSLLSGRLAVTAELGGVRGELDPASLFEPAEGSGGFELPVDFQQLTVTDLQLTASEWTSNLPPLSIDSLEVQTAGGRFGLTGRLSTPDGHAAFTGSFDPDLTALTVDVTAADVVIARYWFPEATGGTATGQVRASADGFEVDAFIHDGSIDYLAVEVTDINGPVTIRDMQLSSRLEASGLDGPLQAEISVDITGENYRGILTGSPRLEQAIPWLGHNISLDLTGIPAEGPMLLQVLVSGWYETMVTGTATGTGTLAGLPLAALHGDFDYQSLSGVSVDARAQLGGGDLHVRLEPVDGVASDLLVSLADIEPFGGFTLNGEAAISFDSRPAGPRPSSASLVLSGEPLTVELTGSSRNTTHWNLDFAGGAGSLSGGGLLDLSRGTVTAQVTAAGLALPGLPWPLDASASLLDTPLELPLGLDLQAELGPLQLPADRWTISTATGLELSNRDATLAVRLPPSGGLELNAARPDLLVSGLPLHVTGLLQQTYGQLDGQLAVELELAGATLEADVSAADGEVNLTGSSDLLAGDWQLHGQLLPALLLTATGDHGDLRLSGDDLTGSGSLELLSGVLPGPLAWQLQGSLEDAAARLSFGSGSDVQATWSDGLQVSGSISEQLSVAGRPLQLQADLSEAGAISGTLSGEATNVTLSGGLDSGISFSGTLPAHELQAQLLGELGLTGGFSWADGTPRLQAQLAWQELTGLIDWSPGEEPLALQLSGPGVSGAVSDEGVDVHLIGLDLSQWLDTAGIPVSVTAGRLNGSLTGLMLQASAAVGPAELLLEGPVYPQADVSISAAGELAGQQLTASGLLSGSLAAPELTAEVTIGPADPFSQAALQLEPLRLAVTLDEHGQLTVSGPASDLALTDSGWAGSLQLGLLVLGEAHSLQVTPTAAGFSASLDGPLLVGDYSEPHFNLQLSGSPAGFELISRASLNGEVTDSGTFTAHLQAETDGGPGQLEPLTVGAQLQGDLSGVTVTANLRGGPEGGRLLTVSGASDWSSLQLHSDLASLDLNTALSLFGVAATVSPQGSVRLSATATGLSWQADGNISGELSGVPVDLTLSGSGTDAALAGTVMDRPFGLNVSLGAATEMTADWDGVQLMAQLQDGVTGSLTAGEASALGMAAAVSFGFGDNARLAGSVGPASFELTGQETLRGNLQLDGLEEALPLTLSRTGTPTLSTSWSGLQLDASLQDGQPQLQLSGDLNSGSFSSNLSWHAARGFTGSAAADGQFQGLGWTAQATATPEGGLQLAGSLDPAARLLNVQAQLSAQPLAPGALTGTVSGYFNLAELVPAVNSRSLSLSASTRLSGSLLQPQLSGSALVMGAVAAEGRVEANLAGGSVRLTGEGTDISADFSTGGWNLAAAVTGVPLERFTTVLPGGLLDLQLSGSDSTPLRLSQLHIRHEAASVTGTGELAGGKLDGLLELDVAMDALGLGSALSGTARGTLRISDWQPDVPASGLLSGQISLSNVSVAGNLPLNGEVFLNGSPAAPRVAASLSAPADGVLNLDWRPAQQSVRLTARLDLGDVATDLYLQSGPESGQTAYGTVRLPGGSFSLSALSGGEFLFTGREAWTAWGVLVDPISGALQASGNLNAVSEAISGTLDLRAGFGADGLHIAGGITGLEAVGISAGDVSFSPLTGPVSGLRLSGPQVDGSVQLTGDWQLSRLELRPTPELVVVVSASGDTGGGSLNASLSGRLLDLPLSGTAAASLGPRGTTVSALIDVLGGQASLDALLRQGNWQGQVALADLVLSGISLSGTGGVFGPAANPRIELTSSANLLGIAGQGTFRLGPNLLSFHQTFSDPALGGDLVLQGSFWPEPRLILSGPDGHSFRLEQAADAAGVPIPERRLVSSGQLIIDSPAASVSLQAAANGDSARLDLEIGLLPGFAVGGDLHLSSLSSLMGQFDSGVQLQGRGETSGDLQLNLLSGQLNLSGFGLSWGPGKFLLDGYANLNGTARISGQFEPTVPFLRDLPALVQDPSVPFALINSSGLVRLVSSSRLGDIEASLETGDRRGSLTALLNSGSGNAVISLAWNDLTGLTGTVRSDEYRLFELAAGTAGLLDADLSFADSRVTGSTSLRLSSGQLSASGSWSMAEFLPQALAPHGGSGGELDVRLSSLELSELPPVAQYVPALSGGVTAVVQLRDDIIAGNLVATGLQAAGSPLPIEAVISGSPRSIEVGASLAGSPLSVTLEDWTLSGLLEMRRFPLQTFAEALAGPLDVSAEVTGVTRFSFPFTDLSRTEFRVATEQVWLERAGIVTTGNVSMELSSGVLEVSQASFSGAGSWEASGVLRADLLDFELIADEADFGPMLGLIPALNQLGVGASGSLSLTARGDLADPQVSLASERLQFELAGISYQLDDLLLTLQQNRLNLSAELLATDPIQGSLELSGSGGIQLSPLAFSDASFSFGGSLVLPVVGQVEGISGRLFTDETASGALLADVNGMMGNPLTISGSLSPLDLTLQGSDLHVDLPGLFLDDSRLDADLRLRRDDGLLLGGSIVLHESLLNLSPEPVAGGASLGGGIAESLRFDNVRIVVPARLRLTESFGSAELAGDLTVAGSLAQPLLSGRADALRGNFQFAGRDFQIQEATAVFEVTRGVYPELRITAVTTFDRGRLLPQGSNLQLVAPADGSAVVTMSFVGAVEADPAGGIRLNIDPLLSSNVLVRSTQADGPGGAPRPLTDDELLALITLGRTDFASLGGEAGLAPMVAQGALETAVDLLIMSGLQRALGEALGLDLVEIRSSALSNLLTGNQTDQQFGISVRFGGYVSDEVFATYRLSAFDDPDGLYAFSNEVGIRYALGPVLLDLAGSLNVQDTPGLGAVAQLSLGLQYEINASTTLEAAFDMSGQEQLFRFGVTWRW